MKIGIITEGKNPPDRRVPFSPEHCKLLKEWYPSIELMIQRSKVRAFSDREYEELGLNMVDHLADANIIFGVKEVNVDELLSGKTYFFFSHTIKKQPYNRGLLQRVLELDINLVDYECLTNQKGNRLLGFGRYAGIVGTYNAFLTYGKRSGNYHLKPANLCKDKNELDEELKKIKLPKAFKIAITGLGRVASGAIEILNSLNLLQVEATDYLHKSYDYPVYTQLSVREYFKKGVTSEFSSEEVYKDPSGFESNFFPYAQNTDLYISCHYWDDRGPVIFTAEDMKHPDFRIRTIADISCDIAGPIPSTLRPSTIENPIYEVDRENNIEVDSSGENTISVMAVDNLPCELPRDASEGFGKDLIDKIIPHLLGGDKENIIDKATIAADGKLKSKFTYLQDYVEGSD